MGNAFEPLDEDVLEAMKEIEGYLDISIRDFRELYKIALKYARERFLDSTPIETIMQLRVSTIDRAAPLETIVRALADNAVSGLPVLDERDRIVGVVSEKDIFAKLGGDEGASFWAILSGCLHSNRCLLKAISRTTAGDLMSSPPITIRNSASVRDALELCTKHNINRLPVVDHSGELVGIVTRTDILKAHLRGGDE